MRDDDGFRAPSPRGHLVGQFLGLAYPKLTIDQDRIALSVDQGRRHVSGICLADEYVEVERFGWRRKYVCKALTIIVAHKTRGTVTIRTADSTKVRVGFMRVTLLIVRTQRFVWHAPYVKGRGSPLALWDGGPSQRSPRQWSALRIAPRQQSRGARKRKDFGE